MIGRRLARGAAELRGISTLAQPDDDLVEAFGAARARSGVSVNERIAVGLPAVMAPASVIAEDVGKLSARLHVYERTGPRTRERANDPLDRLLCVEPNPEMTSLAFWEAIAGFLKLWHRAYAYIERDRLGRVIGLWPMAPNRTRPARDVQTGELLGYRTEVGANHEPVDVLPRDTLAFEAGLFAGDGKSPIMRHREAIGLAVASEEYAARYFLNDASAGGIIEIPRDAPDGAGDRLEARWRARHEGLPQKFRVGILEGGATWKDVGAPPRDAQFVESQRMSVLQGCRIMRCPPHKVAELERATFSNIEQQNIEYVVDSLGGPCTRVEVELRRKLWPAAKHGLRGERFAEFLFDDLLRGDIRTRYTAYAIGRQWGWLSADDVRAAENMTPLPNGQGEHYLQPLNMVPAGNLPEPAGVGQRDGLDPQLLGGLVRLLSRSVTPPVEWPADDEREEVVEGAAYPALPMTAANGNGAG